MLSTMTLKTSSVEGSWFVSYKLDTPFTAFMPVPIALLASKTTALVGKSEYFIAPAKDKCPVRL